MERIFERQTDSEYKEYMKRYAIETNWKRHTADVRDGMKSVQRRIIDSMANRLPGKSRFLKTAMVVGDTIGTTHPHGDSSVKSAIKLLANWFDCKVPLVESESNMGSMQGASDAASRYTEVKLSQFTIECVLAEMREIPEVVDWKPNYANTDMEPEYFPVAVPLLLINGTFGIGTGLKALVPPHNLVEVLDATIKLIKNPASPVVLIPDQCMGVDIIDTNWKAISNKGHGKYTVRAVIETEEHNGCYWLIIKSIPDMVYFDKGKQQLGGVKYNIFDKMVEGKLPQITSIDQDSKGNDLRIIIKLRRGSDPEFVKQVLYKETALQSQYTVNFEALYGLETLRFSYKSYLELFIEQRKTTKYRFNCIKLQKYNTRAHELDSYIKLIESGHFIDVVNMIHRRKTANDDDAIIEFLIKQVKVTDIQAKFIIGLKLTKITIGQLDIYKKELKECQEKADHCMAMILDEKLIEKEIIDELEGFKKKYGKPRVCRVVSQEDATDVPKGTFKVVVTENNYIKKLPENEYVGAFRGDNPKHVIIVDNTEDILLFSAQGRVFNLPVSKIPLCEKGSIGVDARIMIKKLASNIQAVMYVPTLTAISKKLRKHYLTVITYNNCIKKMDIEDFLAIPQSGLIYTKVTDGDSVRDVSIIADDLDLMVYSDRKALRMRMIDIPKYKRSSIGVAAMKLPNGSVIDGMSVIYPDATDAVVVTEKGKVNRFPISGLARSGRYTAGNSVIKLAKGDRINSIFGVNENNTIIIHGKNGTTTVNVSELKPGSSISSGEKAIQTSDIVIHCSVGKIR